MVQESKKSLRREMKLILANLDPRWLSKAHAEACGYLSELVKSIGSGNAGPKHILAWIPFFHGEIDLAGFIGEMLKDNFVYLPRVGLDGKMDFVRIGDDWGARLAPGFKGILQPEEGYGELFVPLQGQDIFVIMPGLAFDSRGGRLGRGAGYYDRFLSAPGLERSIKIGVCWSVQIVPTVPTDHHDVTMDWICYERGVLKVNEYGQ
jgi:5-formyltetrahydrofolate cyclo-ligase